MKINKSNLYLLSALAFLVVTCVIVNINYKKVKSENDIIAFGKQELDENVSQSKSTLTDIISSVTDTAAKSPEDQARIANVTASKKVIEIKEKMFLAQVNDVYLNSEDYLGKIIKLEGLFKSEQYTENAEPYCFVLRYGPGCCGSDGNAGFEVAWNKQDAAYKTMPKEDDWVEAVGVLETVEDNGTSYLYLALLELNILDKRGQEYVAQ